MVRARKIAALALFSLAACGKTEPPSRPDAGLERARVAPASTASAAVEPPRLQAPPVAAPQAPPPHVDDDSFRYPNAERIIAVGDIHGDVRAARAALRLGGAIDETGQWIGGKLVVVQTGDQLDRGDDEPEILALFERLQKQAKLAGGALYALDGNHEIMNVQGDFRYVTDDGFHDFSTAHARAPLAPLLERLPAERRGRAAAFLPGGDLAKRLATRSVVIEVGDSVFVHGGVLEAHVSYGLGRINNEVQAWMLGAPTAPAPQVVTEENALIWVRAYSDGEPSAAACQELTRVLGALSAKRMVVGHTVQKQGINSACDAKVWRIDVGLSRYYGGKPSVLEIRGDAVRALL